MSLKAFHILFIFLATVLALGCAWLGFARGEAPLFGAASLAAAVGLVIYGITFIRKARKIIV